jgi:hypothetical protein
VSSQNVLEEECALGWGGQALACKHFHGEARKCQALEPALEMQADPASWAALGHGHAGWSWGALGLAPRSSAQRPHPSLGVQEALLTGQPSHINPGTPCA